MKKPVVDYKAFRLSKITQPQYRHILLLLGWVGYFLMYLLTENLIPLEQCHDMSRAIDDKIPFLEGFVLAYVYWYAYLVLALLWYFLYDIPRFRQLQIFIIITQVVAMITYIAYPSMQTGRPDLNTLGRSNFFTWILSLIYGFDTPTGVNPSLHVAYSFGIASVFLKDVNAKKGVKAFMLLSAIVISASTLFVKQHAALDVLGGALLGCLAEALVFGKSWYLPRLKRVFNRHEAK